MYLCRQFAENATNLLSVESNLPHVQVTRGGWFKAQVLTLSPLSMCVCLCECPGACLCLCVCESSDPSIWSPGGDGAVQVHLAHTAIVGGRLFARYTP